MLRRLIDQRAAANGGSTDDERFTIIGDLLRETVAAPKVRSALYRVAAGLNGVELAVDDRRGTGPRPIDVVMQRRINLERCSLGGRAFLTESGRGHARTGVRRSTLGSAFPPAFPPEISVSARRAQPGEVQRRRFFQSPRISRAAFWPFWPVTPPPGCAPAPAR